MTTMYSTRFRRYAAVALVAAVFLVAACQAAPLKNPDGTSNGLAATPTADYSQERTVIALVATAPVGSSTGYSRSQFGSPWLDQVDVPFGHNGCDARDDILKRDMTDETFRATDPDCTVETGNLDDPYTNTKIVFTKTQATRVQIDHVIPLSYSWKMGANAWTTAQRKNFANDPLNLLAVDGPANGSKSDKGPAAWMPPNTAVWCSYSIRFAQVATKYRLPVAAADKTRMLASCS